jgi:ATP-binding cassette, subfamily B, bacterial MsbA
MNFETLKKILIRLYKSYVKKYLDKLILSLLLSFGVAGSTAAIAWLLDPAIEKMFIEQNKSMMILIPIAIVVAFVTKGSTLYLARTILIRVGNEIVLTIQTQLSSSILKSDIHTLESEHSGKYLSHVMYDVGQVNTLVTNGVLNLMKDSLTLIVLVVLMFYQNWKLAIFAMLMMPLAAFVAKSLGKRIGKASTESLKLNASLTSYLSEMLKGSRMIRIFQKEEFELDRSKRILKSNMDIRNKIGFIMIRATPIMEALTGIMIAGFIYYSGAMISSGEMGINNFFSFLTAMMLAYQPIRSLATLNMMVYQGAAGAERVFGVLDIKPNIEEIKSSPDLTIGKGDIEFRNVSFVYPKTDIAAVENIEASIKGGSTVALVGHSGAGKSTIINLLPRFFDPTQGQVLIDGQSINKVSLSSLRKNVSMVSQDIILFDDTVRANISYAKLDASDEEIKKACDFAAASDFIEKLPKSYETKIGENAMKLSGGQKQRISIARAVLKNSPIILLDEATSSLDAESEEKVQNAILNLTKNKTTLVIAHRLSTIIRADKIFVLNQGKIVDVGNHSELLKNSTIYKNLYSKQIS